MIFEVAIEYAGSKRFGLPLYRRKTWTTYTNAASKADALRRVVLFAPTVVQKQIRSVSIVWPKS